MEEKFFTFTYNDHIYTVDLNSKKSREDCQARINHNTGKKFKWFKESTGKKNWFYMTLRCTMYDAVVSLRITMLYCNISAKTLDQKFQLTQVAADVCLHFMVVILRLRFLTSPTLTQKT